MEIKYAVYPGTVKLYNGTEKTLTAVELATLYGVENENYLVINSPQDIPATWDGYLQYIHLKPRRDDRYVDIKETAQDDGSDVTWGPDFDGDKRYTQETRRRRNDT